MPIIVFPTFALLAGCQEDSRASQTTLERSAELTENRLDHVTGNFLETFGQPKSASSHRSAGGIGARELSWGAPAKREDGSALPAGDIAGYRIYFRLRHQRSHQVIDIDSPGTTRYSLANLAAGAYEFSITAVDISGRESQRSAPVAADIF